MKALLFFIFVVGIVAGNDLKEYINSNLQFSGDLYEQHSSKITGNFLICPYSAQTVLALAAMGAKGNTAKQLSAALRLPNDHKKLQNTFQTLSSETEIKNQYQLARANKIYLNKEIQIFQDFETVAENTFKSEITNIDFTNEKNAIKEINAWVENSTYNKIKNLMSEGSIKPETAAIIINTLYFHGLWVDPFGADSDTAFYVSKTETIDTKMMSQRNFFNYHDDNNLNAQFLEVPFKGDDVVMTFVLPKEVDGLASLEKCIPSVLAFQSYGKVDVEVSLPKFTIESKINIKTLMQDLGAKEAFTLSADFKGISDTPLYISDVIQKTFIEINEKGATAAAATEATLMPNSMPTAYFTADHPFIYYLRHKVYGVLFVGRFASP
ncbi:hypothetical protein FQA39_LY15776 [Lamprigera yunnana]|nr:hypothetical protein FQA39_LY15776 [Lamprigera yunnana]